MRDNLRDLDGIYLHLHGASYVEEIGSGEHHLVAAIRQIVGPYLPLAVSCDPHGNLTKEYVENTTFIRSYREAPHTDIAQTVQRTCRALIELIRHRQNITPVYRKLPLIWVETERFCRRAGAFLQPVHGRDGERSPASSAPVGMWATCGMTAQRPAAAWW